MDNESAIDKIAAANREASSMSRRAVDEARIKEMRALQQEMREAREKNDTKALDLLNVRLKELIESEKAERQALVDSLKGLRDAGKALGVEINMAEKPTDAEIAAENEAKAAFEAAEAELKAIEANPPWLFAEKRTADKREALKSAEEQLEHVLMANARAISERLDRLPVEEASQRLIQVSENSQQSIEDRRTTIKNEVESALGEIKRLQKDDQKLASDLDKLKLAVEKADQQRSDAKVDLDRLTPGTEEYSKQQQVLQTAEDAYKTATNERDTAMEVRNQVQLNLEYTKTHLAAQRDIETALMVFQKTMEEQRNGLVVQYKSRVEAARALADLKFGSDVQKTGNAVMEGFADYMAKAGASATGEVVQMAEEQPEAIRRARETIEQQREASQASQARIDAVFADMERDYKESESQAA